MRRLLQPSGERLGAEAAEASGETGLLLDFEGRVTRNHLRVRSGEAL